MEMMEADETEKALLFSTPVFLRRWNDCEDLNAELAQLILAASRDEERRKKSNAGGWQTTDDLFLRQEAAFVRLKMMVDAMLLEAIASASSVSVDQLGIGFRIDAWANVSEAGHYNVVHSHPNAIWSGVYYVCAGCDFDIQSAAGKIEFLDPRNAVDHFRLRGLISEERQVFANQPGLMLVFPGWLKHMVHPHSGPDSRISVAFNAVPLAMAGRL